MKQRISPVFTATAVRSFTGLPRFDAVLDEHTLDHDVVAIVVQGAGIGRIDLEVADALLLVIRLQLERDPNACLRYPEVGRGQALRGCLDAIEQHMAGSI